MKTIRIIHLFPKLLSLYGEYGNVSIVKKFLEKNGFEVIVEQKEFLQEGIFKGADFVYVGSGTEDNLIEANKRLVDFSKEIKASVENTIWLVTGNAMTLFGTKIQAEKEEYTSTGIFEYTTKLDYNKRFSGDVLTNKDNIFGAELVGYINTSSIYSKIDNGMLRLALNEKLGNTKEDSFDGFNTDKFFATQLIGPFLVKNPAALKLIYQNITGNELILDDDEYVVKAYNVSHTELKNRLKQN